ncbi:MAG: EF-hand domain-containing protein [Planctomycetota bacterium]|nr:EF-hand domain-containing protein [Planctomycetota bacterium]
MRTALVLALATGFVVGQAPRADRDGPPSRRVVFTEDIAPIVFQNCTSCHRAGQGAPFPLETYRQTRRRARMIARVTESRFMPPWHPVEGHGEFVGAMRLSDAEIALFDQWVKDGMREGDPDKLPPMPDFPDGWQLGEPDLVVQMPKGYTVPAGGPDIYRNFVVPLDLEEEQWLAAIEVRPSARTVLHHIIFDLDRDGSAKRSDGRDGQPGFGGMTSAARGSRDSGTAGLGGWAVGGQASRLPMGLARRLPPNTDLILRSHFHPSGKEEVEQTTLGLYFADEPPTREMVGLQLPPLFGIAAGLDIPPGEANFLLEDSFTLPVDALALTVGGHAHYLCREMQIFATPPDGERESIFFIDDWAFNWQNRYQYLEPVELAKGTKIDARIRYDNSADNANNPSDPPKRVRWGQQSEEEMGSITLLLVAKDESERRKLQQAIRSHSRGSMRGEGAVSGFTSAILSQIKMMDANQDGKIDQSEMPRRFRRWMGAFDTNGDGVLDEEELDNASQGSLRRGGRNRRDR